MVVAVHQPYAERAAMFTIYVLSNNAHLPVQGQYAIPAQINGGMDAKRWLHPNTCILAN